MSLLEKRSETVSEIPTVSISTVCDNQNTTSSISLSQLPQRSYSCSNDAVPNLEIPKKRGGFMIMSVTDNESTDDNNGEESIDGDESCDDFDELQTDANVAELNAGIYSASQHKHIPPMIPVDSSAFYNSFVPFASSNCHNVNDQNYLPYEQLSMSAPQISCGIPFEVDAKSRTNSFNYDQHPLHQFHAVENSTQISKASVSLQQDFSRNFSKESSRNERNSVSAYVSCSNVPVTTKISASTNTTPSKTIASRVYKVVKRESIHPVKRELSRWTCHDFSDAHSPNFSFAVYLTNDSRTSLINDSFHSHVVSNSTSSALPPFGFHPSESFMSAYGESRYFGPSVAHYGQSSNTLNSSSSAYYSSGSSSSINHDVERQKIYKSLKPIFETSEFLKRRHGKSNDSRVSEASSSDQDALKSATQHSDTGSNPDYEDESAISSNIQLDNKIEAAMDLVKKHLMLAVRDEVDDLRERIYELQLENEAMKNLLTYDQQTRLQQSLNRALSIKHGCSAQISLCQASIAPKHVNPHQVSASNHIGHQASQGTHTPLSSHTVSTLRTSTVFSHHQTGTHSPKIAIPQLQSISNSAPYPGFVQFHANENAQHFAPPPSPSPQISVLNNAPMSQHYPAPQITCPSSVINPTLPYTSNFSQLAVPITHQ